MILYLRTLRTLLRYDLSYYILLFITLLYVLIIVNNGYIPTKYNINTNKITGVINNIKWDGNHLTLELIGKEKIIANYYYDNYELYKKDYNNFKLGDTAEVYGTIKAPMQNTNFNLVNYRKYLLSNKIYWTFNVDEIDHHPKNNNIFYNFKNHIISYLKKYNNSYPYLKSFLLGDNSDISPNIKELYVGNGIGHLLNASGMRITLLSTLLLLIFKKIFRRTLMSYGITIMFLFLYMTVTNFSISVIRSTSYFFLIFINRTFNFRIKPINIIILILILILLDNPYSIYNIGFYYTFIISIFINHFRIKFKRYKNYISKTFIISLVAFLSTIPIMINTNFSINLLTPFINVLFIPIIIFIILPFSVIILFTPSMDSFLYFLIKSIESILCCISAFKIEIILAHMPIYTVIIYYVFIYIFIKGLFNKKVINLMPLLILLFIHKNIAYFNNYPSLTMIDVGQGDSILITLPHNKGNILFDTGGKINYDFDDWKIKEDYSIAKEISIPYLKSMGINKIDYLILTHGDADHVKEAINIIDKFKVNQVLFNSGNLNESEKIIVNKLKNKNIVYKTISQYTLEIDKYKFYFINKVNASNENKDGLIALTKLNNHTILMMADADKENEEYILKNYNIPKIDVLKVSHHGSKYNTSSEFINRIDPKISLISVGINNLFNHPSLETLDILKKSKVYQTSIYGSIRIILGDKMSISYCFNNKFK